MVFHIGAATFLKQQLPSRETVEESAAGRLFTRIGDVGAGLVPTSAGDAPRERTAALVERAKEKGPVGQAAGTVVEFAGLSPQSRLEAGISVGTAFIPLPVGRAGSQAFRLVGRGGGRAGSQAASQTVRQTTRTGARAGTRSGAKVGSGTARQTTRATTRGGSRAGAGAGARGGADTAGRAGAGAGGIRGLARRHPLATGIIGGGAVLTGGSLLLGGRDDGGSGGSNGDPHGPGGGGGSGGGGDGGGGSGPDFATDPFFGNITAGLGSMFDRIGAGIAGTLQALGIPIGEGAGKAIAIGGTAVLIAIAVAKGAPALAAAGKSKGKAKPKAKAKGAGKAPAKSRAAIEASHSPVARGPGGRFVSKGGA